jgi:tetratricopeptide (TPR) repeat protein
MNHPNSLSKFCTKHIALYQNFIIYCILALITSLVYLQSLHYPFQFDDLPNILNYTVLKFTSLRSLFFTHSRWICTLLNSVIYQYYQSDPWVCRCINLLIHVLNGALVFWLVLQFKSKLNKQTTYLAVLTTSLFLLHPVQTQTISYVIQGQLEGLASLFILCAILAFYYYIKTINVYFKIFSLASLFVNLILATSTKEIAIITPFLILLTDWFWLSCGDLKSLKKQVWLHLGLFSTTFIIYGYYLKPAFFWKLMTWQQSVAFNDGNLLTSSAGSISQYQFLISQFKVILHYLTIFIWPFNICVEYDWQLNNSFWEPSCFVPFLILIFLGFLILLLFKKDRTSPVAFGLLWFLICILPRSSIVASGELLVDYKTYLASIGWLFTLACFINFMTIKLTPKHASFFRKLILVILIITLAHLTITRNQVWRSARAFWYDVITKAPHKARGFNNYGMALVEEGLYEKAIFYFKHAIELNQRNQVDSIYWDPYKNLANAYALTNQLDLAIDIIKQGLVANPQNATLHNNLGALLLHQNDYENSIKHLKRALELKPNLEQALYTLGKAYLITNQPALAWQYLHQGCLETHLDRNSAALELYAQASIQTKNLSTGIWALQKLVNLQPQNIMALFNLGSLYYFTNDYERAVSCYQKILALDPDNQAARAKLKLLY